MTYRALTIAGSDSGGGAGIQADLKTFQELKVFGMSAITAITAQNTLGVQGVYPMTPSAVAEQIESVASDIGVDAIKTGMLFDSSIIRVVAEKIRQFGWEQVVVDPVMIAKGGAPLLQQEAMKALKEELLPLAKVVTPNIPEAEAITGMTITTMDERQLAARKLYDMGVKNVVIKGGHDDAEDEAIDLLFDGSSFTYFTSKKIETKHTHGTGCTFAAAIAASLAQGKTVIEAVQIAKDFIQAAIENNLGLGHGHGPTNHWAYKEGK
ncbi:bifunctional hydroxymethylpyrimidine kinase/phosphomethylpyrimidine kinase [Ectobacillus polymachus]|uniref:bifunctional hydroxymethylpyrimidine kinase/phosphomethylpyrimidine kinase n=1 Tax=Ectobacillus polymachus TaxID=1508806 RepID=UPI003A83A559